MQKSYRKITCLAHRGASGYEPENTLRSLARALELGADWVEFDVRAVENEAVLFHDRTLLRCLGRAEVVAAQSLQTLRSYDLGKGERVPLLSEALHLLKGRAGAQVELKGGFIASIAATRIEEALSSGWGAEKILVSSFDYEELLEFKRLLPHVPRALLLYGYPWKIDALLAAVEPTTVHLHIDSVTPSRIAHAHNHGLQVFVYSVDDPNDIEYLRQLGVDGIFSNFPERVNPR
jgi:glycerophosphoryl diester phosphodiesterase